MKWIATLFLVLVISLVNARPTSNVINALYSVPDSMFAYYGMPELSFSERVQIFEGQRGLSHGQFELSSDPLYKKELLRMDCLDNATDSLNTVFFYLVKDRVKKRRLLFAFYQPAMCCILLERVDVFTFEKKPTRRWKKLKSEDFIPNLGWEDLYENIKPSDKAVVVNSAPPLEVDILNNEINVYVAGSYLETKYPGIMNYIQDNSDKQKYVQFVWNKESSKFDLKKK